MPNYIQYSTSITSGSLKKGNAALGITNEVTGPTSTTGWYSGINPQSGSYVVYEVAASGDPDIYCPQNSTELLNLVKSKGATGGNTGSVAAALAWIATQPNLLATNEVYPNIVTDGDVLNLDAQFVGSYPITGSTWYDVSGANNNGTLTNGPIFNSLGVINFDNVDDYVQISSSLNLNTLAATRNMTICFTAKKLFYGTGGNNTGDSMILIGADNGYDSGFRITEINTGTPGTPFTGSPHYNFGAPALGNGFAALSPRAINTNTFSYVCFAQSGSSITSFINGKFATGTLPNAYTPGANRGSIGRDIGAGVGWFGGYIGNFQIYNRTLSQAEILQNYYQSPIVTNGLIISLDPSNLTSYESGSASTYSMTGSASGSLINGIGYNGGNGGCWVSDGVDDTIQINYNFSALSTITINFFANSPYSNNSMIWSMGSNGPDWYVLEGSMGYNSYGGDTYGFSQTQINNLGLRNNWRLITMTYTQNSPVSNNKVYVNGIEQSTSQQGGTTNSRSFGNSINFVSAFNNNSYNLAATIGYISIYNRELTAAEVLQNYNALKTRFGL